MKGRFLNGWNLLGLFSAWVTVIMLVGMASVDLSSAPGVSAMIQLSARCAVPFVYLAFAASSLHVIFSSDGSAWLLRNRKYFGLSFAVAMAWQVLFILWMVLIHTDYYVDEVYVLRDVIEGVVGYIFVALMVITSFRPGRRLLSRKQWRLLHKSGIYFLWAYAFSVYWWGIFYSGSEVVMDYVLYALGFAAWSCRAAAWHKERIKKAGKDPAWSGPNPAARALGGLIIVLGIWMALSGDLWYPASEGWVYGYSLTQAPELYVPYWPFEPFWPLAVIAVGTYGLSVGRRSSKAVG